MEFDSSSSQDNEALADAGEDDMADAQSLTTMISNNSKVKQKGAQGLLRPLIQEISSVDNAAAVNADDATEVKVG